MPWDWDDVLAYKTYKTVYVRDRWLGAVYYSCIFGVLSYAGLGMIWQSHGYERKLDVFGAVRSSVQAPHEMPPLSQLNYCDASGSPPSTDFAPQLPCVYPDESILSHSVSDGFGSLLIGTRMSTTIQEQNINGSCAFPAPYPCKPWSAVAQPKESFYLGALENCTVVIFHSIAKSIQVEYATSGNQHDNNFYIADTFMSWRPNATMHGPPRWNAKKRRYEPARSVVLSKVPGGDLLTMEHLLFVAGLSDTFDEPTPESDGQTNTSTRFDGQTIRVRIVYTGDRVAYTPNATYAYHVSINDLPAKMTYTEDRPSVNGNRRRATVDLHGLQLLFYQEGDLLVFDWVQLRLTIVSALTFLAVAKTVADLFMLYLAPRRGKYKLFVQSASPDFTPSNEAERLALDQLIQNKRRKRAIVLAREPMNAPLAAADWAAANGMATLASSEQNESSPSVSCEVQVGRASS